MVSGKGLTMESTNTGSSGVSYLAAIDWSSCKIAYDKVLISRGRFVNVSSARY